MNLITHEKYLSLIKSNENYIQDLYDICSKFKERIEGNCFYEHMNINNRTEILLTKQMNLFSLGGVNNNIMEIGFNAGHSTLLFLLSNPKSFITVFDLCEHDYTMPCFRYLNEKFPNRLQMIAGNSIYTLPNFYKKFFSDKNKFDLIHIDGCHYREIANKDFFNSLRMADNFIVFDDTQDPELNGLFELYLQLDLLKEVHLHETFLYKHRIGQIIK